MVDTRHARLETSERTVVSLKACTSYISSALARRDISSRYVSIARCGSSTRCVSNIRCESRRHV